MRCPTCGHENAANANFCGQCRNMLPRPAAPPVQGAGWGAPQSPVPPAGYGPPTPPPVGGGGPSQSPVPPMGYGSPTPAPMPGVVLPPGAGAAPGYPTPQGSYYPYGGQAAPPPNTITDQGVVQLLPGEQKITRLAVGKRTLYLTSQRVVLSLKGLLRVACIQDIDSVSILALRLPIGVLVTGVLVALFGVASGASSVLFGDQIGVKLAGPLVCSSLLVFLGVGLVVLWWLYTRMSLLLTVSGEDSMLVSLGSLNQQVTGEMLAFLDAYYQARAELDKP